MTIVETAAWQTVVQHPVKINITREEIIAIITEGVEQHGDYCNPRESVGSSGAPCCIYIKDMPRPHENRWCVIGYVAHQLGWSMPNEDEIAGASGMARELGWPISLNDGQWIDTVQGTFDGVSVAGEPLNLERTWQEALNICTAANWFPEAGM